MATSGRIYMPVYKTEQFEHGIPNQHKDYGKMDFEFVGCVPADRIAFLQWCPKIGKYAVLLDVIDVDGINIEQYDIDRHGMGKYTIEHRTYFIDQEPIVATFTRVG